MLAAPSAFHRPSPALRSTPGLPGPGKRARLILCPAPQRHLFAPVPPGVDSDEDEELSALQKQIPPLCDTGRPQDPVGASMRGSKRGAAEMHPRILAKRKREEAPDPLAWEHLNGGCPRYPAECSCFQTDTPAWDDRDEPVYVPSNPMGYIGAAGYNGPTGGSGSGSGSETESDDESGDESDDENLI